MKSPTQPGPSALKYLERDAAVVSPSYPRVAPFVMDHGKGSEVWDVDGNRYLDLASGIAVCSTGHSHPKVVEAVKRQADRFLHISSDYYHPIWIECSERLASIAPFKEPARVFLCNSGTEAVEAAIKLARRKSGRKQFIGFYGGFHGRSMGSLAFTASKTEYRRGFFPMLSGVTHVPFPNPYRPVLSSSGELEGEAVVKFIEETIFTQLMPPEDCAAVLLEPIQGEGGYIVPPDSFFPALRALCDKHGILMIVDEVQSGVGRTGKWWAVEHWGVEPDIVCSAKGLASGLPLGAMISRASLMDWPPGAHGNTYGGNPLACSASLATLELIENGMMQNAAEVGQHALDALAEIQARSPNIGHLRGKGLMIGVELVKDKDTKKPAHDLRERAVEKAFEDGLLIMGCGRSTLRLAPPLNITKDQIDEGLLKFEKALREAATEGAD
ncbi:MAG: acetyl ornithine aminotransferase family protein [Anaerolineales bacterium]